MSRTTLISTVLVLCVSVATAGTFDPAPYLPEADVNALTRTVANQQFGRDLFGSPYATVVLGNVDVYDRFPYLESRYFQIVSDPQWNRLLMGEIGQGLAAYDGDGSSFGRLASPRGLSSDAQGRVYVADANNNRVLVFQTASEFDRLELEPLFSIEGLHRPYDVAYSDGGTPFDTADDRVYVANTGRNEIRLYTLTDGGASFAHAVGELGSGTDRFAGPIALTVGHRAGAHSDDIYVSDAHNSRLVHLKDTGNALAWAGEARHKLGPITSLDSDHWGNVYVAAPHMGKVAKFTSALFPIASFEGDVKRPRSFHVPFANVTDHRTGEQTRAGQGSGILIEEWDGSNGIRLLNLGVELTDAAALKNEDAAVSLTLTDHATLTATITDPRTGIVVARHEAGMLDAGRQTVRFADADYVSSWSEGEYVMTVTANSGYDKRSSEIEVPIQMTSSGSPQLPDRLTLMGNTPNPFNPTTTIRFMVPQGANRPYSVRVYDVRGGLVRELANGNIGEGVHQLLWDGRSDTGGSVGSGIYFYRIEVGQERSTGKMVLLK